MFENLVEVLKANPRKIVYTEGTDARILESAARLKQGGFLTPILVGNVEDVKAAAKAGNFDIEGLEIIDPANYDKMDEMAQCMFDLRKGKMTMEEVRANLQKGNYFGTMLVKMGVADALLGGATYSTADTVRPALQLIKTKKGAHLVSSCFIMVRGDEMLAMGDCAINIDYQDNVDKATGEVTFSGAQKLAEVAIETALGGALQNIVVENEAAAKAGIALLRSENAGRATFLPLDTVQPGVFRGKLSGSARLASSLVQADARYSDIVSNLLGRIIVVDDINEASRVARDNGFRSKVVTLDGQVVNAGGSLSLIHI